MKKIADRISFIWMAMAAFAACQESDHFLPLPPPVTDDGTGNNGTAVVGYDSTEEFPVESGYGKLLTLCYSLPETVTDEVLYSSAFQITAGISTSRSVTGNYSPSSDFEEEPEEGNLSVSFHAGLRHLEEQLLRSPGIPDAVSSRTLVNSTVAVVGDSDTFYVLEGDTFRSVQAECVAVTDHTAFWKADSVSLASDQLQYLTGEFEAKIPTVHEKFGEEGDIDGNGQIFVLMAPLDEGIFGYFYSIDKLSQEEVDAIYREVGYRSNEADLFYVNSRFFSEFDTYCTDIAATLVHEMQHMVHFNSRKNLGLPTVESWLNEGLSMLCEYYCGYTDSHEAYIASAFKNPGISLIESPETGSHYGYVLLFLRYLQERFGDTIVDQIYHSSETGVLAVQSVTEGQNFNDIFADFCRMILETGRGETNDSRYEIAAFNYEKGTDGYIKNGFNLAQVVDNFSERMDLRRYNQLTMNPMKEYAFFPIRWVNAVVSSFRFSSTGAELLVGDFPE